MTQKTHMREFASGVPTRLAAVIVGLVMVTNARLAANLITDIEWGEFAYANLRLLGGILIGLGFLKLAIDWYLAFTSDIGENIENKPA